MTQTTEALVPRKFGKFTFNFFCFEASLFRRAYWFLLFCCSLKRKLHDKFEAITP
jgi:hypothetical protein